MNRPRFRRAIGEVCWHAHESRHRGNIYDAATTSFSHSRDRRFAAQEDTFQIGVDDTIPLLFAGVINHLEQRRTGVIDEDIKPAILTDCGVDHAWTSLRLV